MPFVTVQCCVHVLTDWCSLQHLSNGPISLDISAHDEQMEEMQFVLDKRTKEVERVTKTLFKTTTVAVIREVHSKWSSTELRHPLVEMILK